jgi:TolA-binding protein
MAAADNVDIRRPAFRSQDEDPITRDISHAKALDDSGADAIVVDSGATIEVGQLSAAEVIAYVQMRLADIDGQIRDLQGDANERKRQSDELRTFQNAVRSLIGVGTNGAYDTTQLNDEARSAENTNAAARLDAAITACKDNPDLVRQLEAFKHAILQPGDDGSKVPGDALQNGLEWAKNQLTSLNSDNEVTMMRLNALIQLRSQIISSASNEQASINDGIKSVISNLRV